MDITAIHDDLAIIQSLLSVLVASVGLLLGVSIGKAFSFWKW